MKIVTLKCDRCLNSFERKESEHLNNLKRGRKNIYCSRLCFNNTPKQRTCQACKSVFDYTYLSQKYCSRACWATNRPKKVKLCSRCNKNNVKNKEKYCSGCRYSVPKPNISGTTLRELREAYSVAQYHAKIRGHARNVYQKSNSPMACLSCGYNLHVDICHIIDVKDFSMDTTIEEVNDIKNLIALDKRCHWEFDNGYLELSHM